MFVSYEWCVLLDRGLCVGLIIRPEESYGVWCVLVWLWSLDDKEEPAHWGVLAPLEQQIYVEFPVGLYNFN
jgi:hypothetical protein